MANVVRYVNTASSAGGDGTTNNTTGTTRAYASIEEWHAAETTNLVTAADTHTVYCCGTSEDTQSSGLIIYGWSGNATYNLTIAGNTGVSNGAYFGNNNWSTSHYRTKYAGWCAMDLSDCPYVTVKNLQIVADDVASSSGLATVYTEGTAGNVVIQQCRIRGSAVEDSISNFIYGNGDTTPTNYLYDCILEYTDTNSWGATVSQWSNPCYTVLEHCSIRGGAQQNIEQALNQTITVYNCALWDSADDFYIAFGTSTLSNNASEDGDGTNPQTITSIANTFTNESAGDYTPKDASSVLVGNGLSGKGSGTDLAGLTRGSSPTIGAFEFPASFKPYMIIY